MSNIKHDFNRVSHSLHAKGQAGSEKTNSNFPQNVYFPIAPIWINVLCHDCITCRLVKPFSHSEQIAEK